MIVADLFAGVGGLSQGFIKAGFEVAFAVEYDKDIANAYKLNHPNTKVYATDISTISVEELIIKYPKIDVIIGGPPCQGYSQKGKRMNLDDPRNFMFLQFIKFVKLFKPKYFLIENVPNIITTYNGYFKDQIISSFEQLGYKVTNGILSALDFGVPQNRKRAVFIGSLGDNCVDLPVPNNSRVTIKDAIYDLPFIRSGEGVECGKYDKLPKTYFQKMSRHCAKNLYNHVATNHSKKALERLALIPKGMGKEVLPKEHRTKSIYSGTWSRLIEDGYAPTITTRFDTPSSGRFTHPILDRCLTVREAARIQTFPDTFIFTGSRTSQMKQVGNAVPPLLAYELAIAIKNNNEQ